MIEGVFDRFTERARKTMGYSRQEAQRFNHDYIGTEHFLLGLIQEGSGVASDALKNLDVDLKKIRREVEKLESHGTTMAMTGQLPFTPGAKTVLELALEEASNFGHNYIGTEHLLLGLIREQKGIAAKVLQNARIQLEDVREEVLELLGAYPTLGEDEETDLDIEHLHAYCPRCDKQAIAVVRKPNHSAHFILTCMTGGVWGIAWIVDAIRGETYRCSRCGAKTGRGRPSSEAFE